MTTLLGHRRVPLLLSITAIIVLVVGCASAGSGGAASPMPYAGDVAGAPAAAEPQQGGTGTNRTRDSAGQPNAALLDEALVVKTGSMELQVTDLDAALLRARTAITGMGGYVSASQQSTSDEKQIASVTYRIPADRWDDALDALKKLSTKLVGEQTQAVEVTGQVVDLEARIDNLQAAEVELRSYIAQATKISEILEIQAQLTQVRGEIEQLTAQLEHLEDQASYGTLAVTWDVPVAPVAEVRTGWDPAAEVQRAIAQLVELGQAVATVVIWVGIVILPIALVVGVVLGIAVLIARRVSPRPPESAAPLA